MKSNLTISVDVELKEKLKKENNYSDLANTLFHRYFLTKTSTTIPEVQDKIKELNETNKANETKLLELKYLLKELEEKNQNLPKCNICREPIEDGQKTEMEVNYKGDILQSRHKICVQERLKQ